MHWIVARHLLRYLAGTRNKHLVFRHIPGNSIIFKGYTDASWAECKITRRSTSGYVFTLDGTAVSWCSIKQKSVSRSSTESEYIALAGAASECVWLRRLLGNIANICFQRGSTAKLPTAKLLCDNTAAISLAHNSEFHFKTKHIDISYHFTRELIAAEELSVSYVSTLDMTADILTKALASVKHNKHVREMSLEDIL
jgi:hypothetical protein